MHQSNRTKTCKKNSIKLDKPIQKIKQIHMHISSNHFQHTRLTRNDPKSFNKNATRIHQILQAFHQDFSIKSTKKALNQGKIIL
jgi:hypothetical protein